MATATTAKEKTKPSLSSSEYPRTWEEFIGQEDAKYQLKIRARAAKAKGRNLPHVLLKSPYAGVGKTAMALLLAEEMDTKVICVTGSVKLADARMLFTQFDDGDILFYDEIHKVVDGGKANAEWLLHYLQDGVLLTPLGAERVRQVTVIGATTDAGRLPVPILDRFKLQPVLERYTDAEGAQIALIMGRKIMVTDGLPMISVSVAEAVAAAATNRPRWMMRVLEGLRDLALTDEVKSPRNGRYDLTQALVFCGVTADGLTAEAQEYLRVLFVEMRGRAAGEALLRNRLGTVGTGLNEIETLLVDKNLIGRTDRGRMLTGDGLSRAAKLFPDAV